MTTPSDINRIDVTVEDDLINVTIASADAVDVSGTNLGAGAQVFKDKQSTVMRYRSITAGTGATVTQNTNDVAIGVDTNTIATKSFVTSEINNLINGAPGALNTLDELAQAMGDDPNFAATVTNQLALKANSADLADVATSGSYADLTGKPSIPDSILDLGISDGSSGQVLTTNGSGVFTFTTKVGETGPQGPTGPTGPQGAQGIQGVKGDTGETGATGATGAKGDKGDTGDTGAAGADGKTIRYGAGAPSNSLGNDGDFYINTSNNYIYGPKSSGT